MKKILLIAAMMIPLIANSQSYFKDGMRWFLEKGGTTTPQGTRGYYTITAEKSSDDGSLMIFQSPSPYGESEKLLCYVKTEGEKVYFKPARLETDDWYLLYDFGLKAGEGCYVHMSNVNKDGVAHRTYVKCTGFNEYSGYYGMDTMTMEEYLDESDSHCIGKGIWIKGLGSEQGPLDNNYFEATGAYSLLNEAYDGDKLVYLRNMTRFKEGTKWQMHCSNIFDASGAVEWSHTVTAEKSKTDDTLMLYEAYDNEPERKFVGYVKAEGDKVFFRGQDSEPAEWYLLYDFGLKPGEGCYIYSLRCLDKDGLPQYKSYVKCTGLQERPEDYDIRNRWNTMTLEEYADESCSSVFTTDLVWIKGLSSVNGVLRNGTFCLDGEGGSLLEKVYNSDNYAIFDNGTAAISKVKDSDSAGIRIDGRNLYVTTEKAVPGAVYGIDGMNLGSYTFGNESTQIELPGKGVYILKIGSESRKIMIP